MDLVEAVCNELDKTIEAKSNSLARGCAKSFEEYQNLCGVIRGLESAKQTINDLANKRLNSDE